jgi:proteic killer suppression protein
MIRSFRSRALSAFWRNGNSSKIPPEQVERVRRRLNRLNLVRRPEEMNLPGFNFHKLRGKPVRYTVHVNGQCCITCAWDGEDAVLVDYEQYL